MRKYALLSVRGTACYETVLTEAEYASPTIRTREEERAEKWRGALADKPVPGTWTDVTDNDAF